MEQTPRLFKIITTINFFLIFIFNLYNLYKIIVDLKGIREDNLKKNKKLGFSQ